MKWCFTYDVSHYLLRFYEPIIHSLQRKNPDLFQDFIINVLYVYYSNFNQYLAAKASCTSCKFVNCWFSSFCAWFKSLTIQS